MTDERRVPEDESLENNIGQQFDRLPATPDDRTVSGRASRKEIVDWWVEQYDANPKIFDPFTFWEKGAGKIWIFADDTSSPIEVEGLGMTVMRTRQRHWKPTMSAAQRFAQHANKNVIELSGEEAVRFAQGENIQYEAWDGDWGYLIVAHELAGSLAPIGVGLYLYGELRSTVPKGRRESLDTLE